MEIDTSVIDGTTIIIDDTYISKNQEEIDKILQRVALIYIDHEEAFH